MKLFKVDTIAQAQNKLLEYFSAENIETETVTLENATERVLSKDIISKENVPSFYRSTVDGYGVKAQDTQGATEGIPVFLEIQEDIAIGTQSTKTVQAGQCAYVPTGGMIPKGADAVVMIEYTEIFGHNQVAVYESVAFGKNVVVPGEDIKQGETLLQKGTVLTAAHIGALAALGIWSVQVYKPLKISVVSTGDELVEVEETPLPGQVRDVNTWSICAFAKQCNMQVVKAVKLNDDRQLLEKTLTEAMAQSDIVITSGGSSQGKKDITQEVLSKICNPGVFTHGLSVKPGKPTILSYDQNTKSLVIGLPGHPVAALSVFQMLVVWLNKKLTNQPLQKAIPAVMETNIPGAPGKTTCLLVQLEANEDQTGYIAKPIYGKSGLINTMTKADGYVEIDMNKEGLRKGEAVMVNRFGL